MSEPTPRFDEDPPAGRYGRVTVLPHAGRGNATPEELLWPLVSPGLRVRSTFLDQPTMRGNATPDELTWPVVDTECEMIAPSSTGALSPVAESEIGHIATEVGDLLNRTPPTERALLLQRLHGLIARFSADLPAA